MPQSGAYACLSNDNFGNYWTSSGPYDEIYYYIENNVDTVRDDLALMIAGFPIRTKIREYAATSQSLNTKEEIFSAMVVYGSLSYENGTVTIPNKELMDKFVDMLQKEPSLGYIHSLAKISAQILQATLTGDTDTYLAARDCYRVEREKKAGIGYVNFIFYPEVDKNADCIILELKIDRSPEYTIRQIKEKIRHAFSEKDQRKANIYREDPGCGDQL